MAPLVSRISVIVPFYNSERYIERCIEGLLSQDYPAQEYEVIMVDNGGADRSAGIVQRYPSITLLEEAKRGSYAARNRGLRVAKGDIVAFTDADCVPCRTWLSEIVAAMREPEIGIVLGQRDYEGTSLPLALLEAYENEKHEWVFQSGVPELYYGRTGNMAVRRAIFDELGPFVERDRGSDTIFVRRCVDRRSCAAVRYSPEMRVRHLEINGIRKIYRKYATYGASSREYGRIVEVRTLSDRERMGVFRKVVREERYSWARSALLLSLLALGRFLWGVGSLSAVRIRRPAASVDPRPAETFGPEYNGFRRRVRRGL